MMRIDENGRVRIIGEKDKRIVNFADRAAELRFAAILKSPDMKIQKVGDVIIVRKGAQKPSSGH